jgi:uncharacterized membrane protein
MKRKIYPEPKLALRALKSRRIILIALALVALLASLSVSNATTWAQSGGTYDLTWNTLDGGGATFSAGGTYELGGTIGQADAGTMSGGQYALGGGFWGFLFPDSIKQYLPMIFKNP